MRSGRARCAAVGCACSGRSGRRGEPTQYEAIGMDGTRYGPYLTLTEAKIKLTEVGGGVTKPITNSA